MFKFLKKLLFKKKAIKLSSWVTLEELREETIKIAAECGMTLEQAFHHLDRGTFPTGHEKWLPALRLRWSLLNWYSIPKDNLDAN